MFIAGSVDLTGTLAALAARRPVFHSEADFQLALAWEVQKKDSKMDVYLETRPVEGVHLDMAFERDGLYTAVELKYLTRAWSGEIGGQRYDLKNHSAHDFRRYDVVNDIARVEQFTQSRAGANGAVIVLTNDPAYRKPSSSSIASDRAFRIGESAVLEGPRAWGRTPAGAGKREDLTLAHRYEMHWTNFSSNDPQLWQLVIEVPGGLGNGA
jgi:hypothetical protein